MGDDCLDDLLYLDAENDLLNKRMNSDDEIEKVVDIFRDMKNRRVRF